ncbi:hypothetical protein CsSME_00045352 [Camellia sinensis var. sinensis]
MPEDFWIRAPKKGIVVFALPGELGLTELSGDFKLHFHDRQGDFYCDGVTTTPNQSNVSENQDNDDDVFSDSDGQETVSSKSSQARADSGAGPHAHLESGPRVDHQMTALSLSKESRQSNVSNEAKIDGAGRLESGRMSDDIKAIAADACVFTFGDDKDFESE